MIIVSVDDLLRMAQELAKDGIKVVEIEELDREEEQSKALNFQGYSPDGFSVVDYEEIEQALLP